MTEVTNEIALGSDVCYWSAWRLIYINRFVYVSIVGTVKNWIVSEVNNERSLLWDNYSSIVLITATGLLG